MQHKSWNRSEHNSGADGLISMKCKKSSRANNVRILVFWREPKKDRCRCRNPPEIRWLCDGFMTISVLCWESYWQIWNVAFLAFVVKEAMWLFFARGRPRTPCVLVRFSCTQDAHTHTHTHGQREREKYINIHKIYTVHRDESVFAVGGYDVKEYSKYSLYQSV